MSNPSRIADASLRSGRRALSAEIRRSENVFYFLTRLAKRTGLESGWINARMHLGRVTAARWSRERPDTCPGRARRARAAAPHAAKRPRYALAHIERLFQARLDRLFRGAAMQFGSVIVEIDRGEVVLIQPAPSYRLTQTDRLALAKQFFAPATVRPARPPRNAPSRRRCRRNTTNSGDLAPALPAMK
jgi:hypothetical protein